MFSGRWELLALQQHFAGNQKTDTVIITDSADTSKRQIEAISQKDRLRQSLNLKRQQVTRPSQLRHTLAQHCGKKNYAGFFSLHSAQLISNQSRNRGMNHQKNSTQRLWMGIVEGKFDIKSKCLTHLHSVNRIRIFIMIFIDFRHYKAPDLGPALPA